MRTVINDERDTFLIADFGYYSLSAFLDLTRRYNIVVVILLTLLL